MTAPALTGKARPGASARFDLLIRPIDWLTGAGNLLAGLCLLGIFVMIGGEILMRNLANRSLGYSWDAAAYLMGASFMFAAASALKAGVHVRVTAARERLGPKGAQALDVIAVLVGLVTAGILAWALVDMALVSWRRGSTSASAYRVPLVWPQAAIALGAVLLVAQLVAQLLRLLRGEKLSDGPGLE